MRLIPGKTKVQIELFRGVTIWDILVGAITLILIILVLISSLPKKIIFVIAIFFIAALLVIRLDEKPNYLMVLHMFRHFSSPRRFNKVYDDEMLKKKAQDEVLGEYLDEYKDDIIRQEEEIEEDPDAEFYEEELLPEIDLPDGSDDEEYEEYEEYEEFEDDGELGDAGQAGGYDGYEDFDEEEISYAMMDGLSPDESHLADEEDEYEYADESDADDSDIRYVDDPDYTDDLDTISDSSKGKPKKKKGLYTITFGKKDQNDEG